MATVNVMIRQQRTFSNPPSAERIRQTCDTLAGISTRTATAQADFIGYYAENWSAFVRRTGTDFTREEWTKRSFKPVAKDFEALLKLADDRFDNKDQTYKNVKVILGKCAYAMLDLEKADGTLKSLTDLKKDLKTAGIGESLATMLTRTCKALAPVDGDTGESTYTVDEYSNAGAEVDDPTVVRRAFEALAYTMGLGTAAAAIQAMQVAQAGGKSSDTE